MPIPESTGILFQGSAREKLSLIDSGVVNTCITSPPYYGLRDYGVAGQIGLEATPTEYIVKLVEVFEGVRRVLRDDGTLWVVIGDSYANWVGPARTGSNFGGRTHQQCVGKRGSLKAQGLKEKDLIGIPWMLAFALRDAGWYLRQEIIWAKGISGPVYRGGSCMPEAVKDRCTKSHETIFLLSKSPRYYFDYEALLEPLQRPPQPTYKRPLKEQQSVGPMARGEERFNHQFEDPDRVWGDSKGRRRRSVWHVNPKPFKGAHFATFPPDLIEPMVLAGAPEGGVVLDPFFGSGTTGVVARNLSRRWIGIELNPNYIAIAQQRLNLRKP